MAFSDLTSISQSRRAAGFWPLAFSFAGGFVVLGALLRGLVLPAALVGGIALQLAYPGEFTYRLEEGGPAFVTWFAVGGGVAALVVGLVFLKHKAPLERPELAAWAAALFVLPVAVHAAANWSPSDARAASPLTPGLVAALREHVARASEGLQFAAAWTATGSTNSAAAQAASSGRSSGALCFRNTSPTTSAATPPPTANQVAKAGPPSSSRYVNSPG